MSRLNRIASSCCMLLLQVCTRTFEGAALSAKRPSQRGHFTGTRADRIDEEGFVDGPFSRSIALYILAKDLYKVLARAYKFYKSSHESLAQMPALVIRNGRRIELLILHDHVQGGAWAVPDGVPLRPLRSPCSDAEDGG